MATTFPATRAAAKPTWPITKIALAVDATPESHRATELARDMAANIGAEVIVLHFRESSLARHGGAERFGAGLIIVGGRGLSTGRAALSGSVSHDLIHASRLPVLIVH